ncbi:hypothetical protein EVAR_4740_1 [Eumeta japonica]|uniref:Uncharacterized protein n=1 Tax=Eumeta variegata TaxID=151549 RepID=A0A4C1T1D1_EUMVA|nr:hypothetical protein EVAR_4740_1 [Eumeta japonica]
MNIRHASREGVAQSKTETNVFIKSKHSSARKVHELRQFNRLRQPDASIEIAEWLSCDPREGAGGGRGRPTAGAGVRPNVCRRQILLLTTARLPCRWIRQFILASVRIRFGPLTELLKTTFDVVFKRCSSFSTFRRSMAGNDPNADRAPPRNIRRVPRTNLAAYKIPHKSSERERRAGTDRADTSAPAPGMGIVRSLYASLSTNNSSSFRTELCRGNASPNEATRARGRPPEAAAERSTSQPSSYMERKKYRNYDVNQIKRMHCYVSSQTSEQCDFEKAFFYTSSFNTQILSNSFGTTHSLYQRKIFSQHDPIRIRRLTSLCRGPRSARQLYGSARPWSFQVQTKRSGRAVPSAVEDGRARAINTPAPHRPPRPRRTPAKSHGGFGPPISGVRSQHGPAARSDLNRLVRAADHAAVTACAGRAAYATTATGQRR